MSLNLYEHLMRGHKDVRLYDNPYYPKPIKLRPLFSWEIDEINRIALSKSSASTKDYIYKFKVLRESGKNVEMDYEKYDFEEINFYFDIIDYYICYYSMRDFQDEKLKFDLFCASIMGVHEMAKFVMEISTCPIAQIMEFVVSPSGKELARSLHTYNIPLVKELGQMTYVQRVFLTLAPSPRNAQSSISYKTSDETVKELIKDPERFVGDWNQMVQSAQQGKKLTDLPVGIKLSKVKDPKKVYDGAGKEERPGSLDKVQLGKHSRSGGDCEGNIADD